MPKRFIACLALCACLADPTHQADAAPEPARQVGNFTLPDPRTGRRVALADFKGRKAVVVLFLGTECPLNNAYLPRLVQLHEEFGPQGVQFLAVNANEQDTADRVAAHARKHALPFPVLKDEGGVVADLFGARRTPEAFVLDAGRRVRYQGRIDDRLGIGYARPEPRRHDLAEAVREVLAGKPVSRPLTPVAGCLIARPVKPKGEGTVTFARQVSRVLQKHCQDCHRPGQAGPMPLLTYDDARAWSAMIREVVRDGRMPPWYADPKFGKFTNDRSLPAADREALVAWVNQGCPRGDDRDLPPPRQFASDWAIGEPDLVLAMPEEFTVPAAAGREGVPYQYFTVDPGFREDRWVERAQVRPGAAAAVHHALVYVVKPGSTLRPDDPLMPLLCGYAAGDTPMILPPGTARRVPAGSKLVFQMHYTPTGKVEKDRSSLGLIFTRGKPRHEAVSFPIFKPDFRIPPGDPNYPVEARGVFLNDGHVVSLTPHLHLRGKDFRIEATYPGGRTETLLSVPRYNFNWQCTYRCAEPVAVPRGTVLRCVAHFDNSADNPNNPDPKRAVTWGAQSWDEMMIGWIHFVFDRELQ